MNSTPPNQTGEATGLIPAIRFAEASASSAREGMAELGTFATSISSAGVSGEPLRLSSQLMELLEQLGGVFDNLATELASHTIVADAYRTVGDDAGEKQFMLEGGAGSQSAVIGGSPAMVDNPQLDSSELDDVEDYEDEDDMPLAPESELYTTCGECQKPLEKPALADDAYCPGCDPDAPYIFWLGKLTPGGKIDESKAECFRRVEDLAVDTFDFVLEGGVPYGEEFVSLDGVIVEAREWIERPENLALAGGRDKYAGRGEFDPRFPGRCWYGPTLPSGGLSRPGARSYDDVAELAAYLCDGEGSRQRASWGPYTVMLPGGELVDAREWAQRPETRRLCMIVHNKVRFRATGVCGTCGSSRSLVSTRTVEGKIGEQKRVAAAIYCDPCNTYLPAAVVMVTLVDDDSATENAAPRLIGDIIE